jgi:PAS domain S-box-containing protein
MKAEKNSITKEASALRKRAEEKNAQSPENIDALLPEEVKRILHELRVHQIELEMQNEELRTSQAKLEASRMRYFDLYDLAPVGYFTISEKGLILEANLTVSTLLSEPRDSLAKRPFSQLIINEDQNIYFLHRNQLFKTNEPQSFDLRMLKKDEDTFWANLAMTVAKDVDDATVIHVVISDITKRKKDEESLIHSRNLMSYIIGHSRSAIAVHDRDLKYLYVSKRYIDDYNVKEDDVIGKHHYDVFPDLPQKWRDVHQMALAGEVSSAKDDPYVRKDGTVDWTSWECRPWYDVDGSIGGIIIYTEIITERKKAEEEKAKLESQLHQSQKLESIGQLAGGIAHDFNNMLSVINGYSEIVLNELNASDPNYFRVEEIIKAGKRSADLTRQLLAFARKQTIVPKILDLNVSVAGMLNMLQRLIGENIKLIWKPAANLWKVKMDPSQIDQILANLIVNTRDAISGVGKVIIGIGNAEVDEAFCKGHSDFVPGKYVVLSVNDNGCGMGKEILEHIFEPFYTTKEVGKGTGLGLSTVFGIVKQNNGFIDVYSEPGKGTTFKIYLPWHEAL